jgi:hypothetical protein
MPGGRSENRFMEKLVPRPRKPGNEPRKPISKDFSGEN